jgi:hypothetical protein
MTNVAGWLLVVGSLIFMIGAANPVLAKAWTAPEPMFLRIVGEHPRAWLTTSVLFMAAAVITAPGLVVFAGLLAPGPDAAMGTAGAVAFAMASLLWLITCAHRITGQADAARAFLSAGEVDPLLAPLNRLTGGLFQTFIVVAFAGLAAVGVAAAGGGAGLVASWLGWATAAYSGVMIVLLFVTGDMPPFSVFVPTLALGVATLVG